MVKICVMIVCYKQQEVIKRALDSVLRQKEYGIHRIVVCDDCSPDNTWEVLKEYKSKYPDIMDIHRNNPNLGIYKNMEKVISLRGDADLYCHLAGDDAYEDGYFKAVQDLVESRKIDLSRPILIYGNFKWIMPSGRERVFNQDIVEDKSLNRFSLYLRHLIEGRSTLMTNALLCQYTSPIYEKGLNLAESYFDSQKHRLAEDAYYVNAVGNIYYAGIGVSRDLSKSDYNTTQAIDKWNYFLDKFINREEDKLLATAEIAKAEFIMNPSWSQYKRAKKLFMMSGYPTKPDGRQLRMFTFGMKSTIMNKFESNPFGKLIAKIIYKLNF